MANNEVLIIAPPQEAHPLSKSVCKHIRIEKSLGHDQQAKEYHLQEINSPKELRKRRINFSERAEGFLGNRLNPYKDFSLPEIEEKIVSMEGVSTSERQMGKTAEDFILKAWGDGKDSGEINLYLWFLNKIYPKDLEDLMIVDEKNRNKLFLLRDQAIAKRNHF